MLYGDLVQDRRLFARETACASRRDIVAAVAALTPEIAAEAAAAIEVEYEPLPAVSDIEAAMADGAPLIHEDWESYEADEELGLRRQRPRLLDHRQGRRRRGDRGGRRRRSRAATSTDSLAGRADRAARAPRPVARRPRDGLELDAGAVRGAGRRRARPADPAVARAHRRPAARRRLRLEVRLPLRGPRRRARARGRPAGEARLLARGGVHRARPPPRGDGHRARDGRAEATGRSSPAAAGSSSTAARTAARAASSRRWRRCTPAART